MVIQSPYQNLHILEHPLIQHKLTLMRDKNTPTSMFRQVLKEVSLLMGYEITRHIPLETKTVETPVATFKAPILAGRKPAIVPILRAGLGMAEALIALMPSARVGHIGLYRDPQTKRPKEYYVKLPSAQGRLFLLVDPMLATGYSAVHALDILKRHGVEGHNIRFLVLVAAPEGVEVVTKAHPDVHIYTAALDEKLNDKSYIVPGLGDAGDRLFGTK